MVVPIRFETHGGALQHNPKKEMSKLWGLAMHRQKFEIKWLMIAYAYVSEYELTI